MEVNMKVNVLKFAIMVVIFATMVASCNEKVKGELEPHFCSHHDNEIIINKTIPSVNMFLNGLPTSWNEERQLSTLMTWLKTQSCVIDATFRIPCLCQSCVSDKNYQPIGVINILIDDKETKKELYFRLSMGKLIQVASFCWYGTIYRWLWALQIKLKPQESENYLAIEDPEITAILSRHDVELSQSSPDTKDSVLGLYYTLRGNSCWSSVVKELFATGKFENRVYHDGWVSTSN